MLITLLIMGVLLAVIMVLARHWLRQRHGIRRLADLQKLVPDKLARLLPVRSRSRGRPSLPHRRAAGSGRARGFNLAFLKEAATSIVARFRWLLLAIALLALVVVGWRLLGGLRSTPDDRALVVRVAPFNVAGQDQRQGRLLAQQLVDVLGAKVAVPVEIGALDTPVPDVQTAITVAQAQRADVLIWGAALEGANVTQPSLAPQLVWLPNGPWVPATWPDFDSRFVVPPTYDLALQPLNGDVVLPLVIESIGHLSQGDVDQARLPAQTLLRDYAPQVRAELPATILGFHDWALGLYADADGKFRTALGAVDRAEHWNNLALVLHDNNQFAPAEAALQRSITLLPASPWGHTNLARLLLATQRPPDALAHADTAVQIAPGVPAFQATRGAAQRASGQLQAARTTMGGLAQSAPTDAALQAGMAVLSLTDVATATGHLEWELIGPPARTAEQLGTVRQQVQASINQVDQRRADYLQQANAYGVAGRIEMQRLAEQAAARLDAARLARSNDLLLVLIEQTKLEAANPPSVVARLWDGLRGQRTPVQEARTLAAALRERQPARQYDLLYHEGRAVFADGALDAAQPVWNQAQGLADAAPPGDPAHRRPEARYGQALVALAANDRPAARDRFNAALQADERFFWAHQQLALMDEQDGAWSQAEAHYGWLATQRPFDANGPLGLARALYAQNRLPEAERVLLPLANASNVDALIQLSKVYRAAGRLDQAEQMLGLGSQVAPTNADLHQERAAVALARNDVALAEAELKETLERAPQRTTARLQLAQLYTERLGQPAAAAEQLQLAANATPDDPNAQRWLGESLLQTGRPDDALRAFQRALERTPTDVAAQHGLAQAYLALNQLDEALQAEQQALTTSNSTFVPALTGMGDLLQRQNRLDEARNNYNAALERDPAATGAYLGLAQLASQEGRPSTAVDIYRRGIVAVPQDIRLRIALGDLLRQTNAMGEAIGVFEEAKRLAPSNPAVRAGLGRALWQAGQADAALAELDQALQSNAADADILLLVGEIQAAQGRIDPALEAYEQAARARSDWFEPPYRRGTLLLQATRTADAIRELERSVQLDSNSAQAVYWLGRAYRAADQLGDAARMFQRAAELNPAYYEARFFLGQTLQAQGDVDQARAIYQALLAEAPPTDPWRNEAQQALGQ